MVITTRVRGVISRLSLGLLLGAVCSYGFDGVTAYASALILALILFTDMMIEDAVFMTVDIRKTAVLGIMLLIASNTPPGNFLLTAGVAFIAFRLLYLEEIFRLAIKTEKKLPSSAIGGKRFSVEPMGLLPAFGIALTMAALYLCCNREPAFLGDIRENLKLAFDVLSGQTWLWVIFVIFWLGLERYKIRLEKTGRELTEGLGMGDVLVMPLFAAYLGLTLFGAVFFLGLLVQLAGFFLRHIMFTPSNLFKEAG